MSHWLCLLYTETQSQQRETWSFTGTCLTYSRGVSRHLLICSIDGVQQMVARISNGNHTKSNSNRADSPPSKILSNYIFPGWLDTSELLLKSTVYWFCPFQIQNLFVLTKWKCMCTNVEKKPINRCKQVFRNVSTVTQFVTVLQSVRGI